jgi:hypothetical protein
VGLRRNWNQIGRTLRQPAWVEAEGTFTEVSHSVRVCVRQGGVRSFGFHLQKQVWK